MSLFRNFAVLRQHKDNPFAPIQILTGDIRKGCNSRRGRLLDERRSFRIKLRIERRFESRSQDGVVSLKHGRLAHVRSQFSLFRRSPTHKNLPLATFCTSERVFAVLFARRKKYQSVSLTGRNRGSANLDSAHPNNNFALTKLKPSQRENRGSANLDSAHRNGGFARTKLKPFPKEIRGFANLESAHKNSHFAQTNLNPSAALRRPFPTFCKVQKVGQKTL